MAALAPMPRARVRIATAVKTGLRLRTRRPYRYVARQVLEPQQTPLVAERRHGLGRPPCLEPRDSHRVVRIVPAAPRLLRHQIQVQPELLLELLVPAIRHERGAEPLQPFTKEMHGLTPGRGGACG